MISSQFSDAFTMASRTFSDHEVCLKCVDENEVIYDENQHHLRRVSTSRLDCKEEHFKEMLTNLQLCQNIFSYYVKQLVIINEPRVRFRPDNDVTGLQMKIEETSLSSDLKTCLMTMGKVAYKLMKDAFLLENLVEFDSERHANADIFGKKQEKFVGYMDMMSLIDIEKTNIKVDDIPTPDEKRLHKDMKQSIDPIAKTNRKEYDHPITNEKEINKDMKQSINPIAKTNRKENEYPITNEKELNKDMKQDHQNELNEDMKRSVSPIASSMAKTQLSFGHYASNRVKPLRKNVSKGEIDDVDALEAEMLGSQVKKNGKKLNRQTNVQESKDDCMESESKPMKSESKPMKSESTPMKSESKPIHKPMKSEIKPMKSENKPMKSERTAIYKPMKSENKPIENESKPIRKPMKSENKPMESESKGMVKRGVDMETRRAVVTFVITARISVSAVQVFKQLLHLHMLPESQLYLLVCHVGPLNEDQELVLYQYLPDESLVTACQTTDASKCLNLENLESVFREVYGRKLQKLADLKEYFKYYIYDCPGVKDHNKDNKDRLERYRKKKKEKKEKRRQTKEEKEESEYGSDIAEPCTDNQQSHRDNEYDLAQSQALQSQIQTIDSDIMSASDLQDHISDLQKQNSIKESEKKVRYDDNLEEI